MPQKTVLISRKNLKGIFSGVKRIVHEEINFLVDNGHKVYVAAEKIDKKAIKASGGIPYKTFRWTGNGYHRRLNYMKAVHKAVDKLKPDLVIGHGDIVNQDLCFIHNCVHLQHEIINGSPIPGNHEVAGIHEQILGTQNFRLLVCNSNLMKNDLTQRFNIPDEKAVVLYPSYNSEKFNPDDTDAGIEYRKKLGFTSEETVIGLITSGNFKKRNLNLMIDTAEKLKQSKIRFKVLIAGNDKTQNYRDRIHALGLEDYFTFAPGIPNVEAYYHCIDIFVLPALIEEFGLSALEAMSCGKPVIVSDRVGCSEIIEGASKEFILSELNATQFAEKLVTLIEDPEKCEQLAALNHTTSLKHSNANRNKDFASLLDRIGF